MNSFLTLSSLSPSSLFPLDLLLDLKIAFQPVGERLFLGPPCLEDPGSSMTVWYLAGRVEGPPPTSMYLCCCSVPLGTTREGMFKAAACCKARFLE